MLLLVCPQTAWPEETSLRLLLPPCKGSPRIVFPGSWSRHFRRACLGSTSSPCPSALPNLMGLGKVVAGHTLSPEGTLLLGGHVCSCQVVVEAGLEWNQGPRQGVADFGGLGEVKRKPFPVFIVCHLMAMLRSSVLMKPWCLEAGGHSLPLP